MAPTSQKLLDQIHARPHTLEHTTYPPSWAHTPPYPKGLDCSFKPFVRGRNERSAHAVQLFGRVAVLETHTL